MLRIIFKNIHYMQFLSSNSVLDHLSVYAYDE